MMRGYKRSFWTYFQARKDANIKFYVSMATYVCLCRPCRPISWARVRCHTLWPCRGSHPWPLVRDQLGPPDLNRKKKITKFRASAWGDDPLIKGAYSASKPGCADQRGVLAAPIAEKLYFAGEACSERAFCTAHGAWETGRDAVEKIATASNTVN